jgi:hypothetical protein
MSLLIPDIQDIEPFGLQQSLKGPDALNIHVIMPEVKRFSETPHTQNFEKSFPRRRQKRLDQQPLDHLEILQISRWVESFAIKERAAAPYLQQTLD